MIQYMPLTYISEPLIASLAGLFGPVSMLRPLETLVPAHMRTAAEKGLLRLYSPDSVDSTVLGRTLNAFTAWADLHKDRAGDLAGFFSSEQGQAAAGQESARYIRAQIRATDRNALAPPSALIQDALFLCLAHTFDQQQEALQQQLHSVASLEQTFGQILGGPGEERGPIGPVLSGRYAALDAGRYMTERRIEAWARLAVSHPMNDPVYITTSGFVWESLCERLPDAAPLLKGYIDSANDKGASPAQWKAYFSEVSQAPDPRTVTSDLVALDAAHRSGWAITVHVLAGCTPQRALAILGNSPHEPAEQVPASSRPQNTIFSYLQIDAEAFQQ